MSDSKSLEEIFSELIQGNQRYVKSGLLSDDGLATKRSDLAENGQTPKAVVVTCSDSRVPPELIFDQSIGDLFVIRTAGNSINEDMLASVEYAIGALNVPLLLVMGHTSCGAICGCLDYPETKTPESPLDHLLSRLKRILQEESKIYLKGAPEQAQPQDWIVSHVAWVMHEIQKQSSLIAEKIDQGQMAALGGLYSLSSGQVQYLASCSYWPEGVEKLLSFEEVVS